MGLFSLTSKRSLLCQTTCFAQTEIATYSASVELRVIMDCRLEVQSTGALLSLIKISLADRLVSFHPAQWVLSKATTGQE